MIQSPVGFGFSDVATSRPMLTSADPPGVLAQRFHATNLR
jgi:hypothetical protein